MAITQSDVPLQDSTVLSMLEERTETMYQFRRAFRNHDATGIRSGSVEFPIPEDDLDGEMVEVDAGSDYPRTGLSYDGVQAVYKKYGFEMEIHDEAVADSMVNVVADAQMEMGEAETARLDSQGYELLAANNNGTTIGNDNEDLDFEAVVAAYTTLVGAGYSPENFTLFVGPDGWGDLSLDDRMNRATQQGDALARNGMLGNVYGTEVVLTNTGDLGADEAILVDTSKYGWLSTRENTSVTSYREEEKDQTVYKIRGRWDYVVADADAAIEIQGGASGA